MRVVAAMKQQPHGRFLSGYGRGGMETLPELEAAGESGDEEPNRLSSGGDNARGEDRSHGSISQAPPPLELECSTFRRTVWAHMDPCKRKRMNLEDFEDRLNSLPKTANKVSTRSRIFHVHSIPLREGRMRVNNAT